MDAKTTSARSRFEGGIKRWLLVHPSRKRNGEDSPIGRSADATNEAAFTTPTL